MSHGRVEILVEPFKENDPGPHVTAVIDALTAAGFQPEMGPFATTVSGDLAKLLAAFEDVVAAGFEAGASTIQLRIDRR